MKYTVQKRRNSQSAHLRAPLKNQQFLDSNWLINSSQKTLKFFFAFLSLFHSEALWKKKKKHYWKKANGNGGRVDNLKNQLNNAIVKLWSVLPSDAKFCEIFIVPDCT